MYQTQKTIFHTDLELQRILKKGFTPMDYSTLNEYFNVAAGEETDDDMYPEVKYIAIGRGGHRGRLDASGLTLIDILQHDATDAVLYEHIPFIVREVDNDLSIEERNRYGMRVLVERNGINYFAYYLKAVDLTQSFAKVQTITPDEEGGVQFETYQPTPAQLSPTPLTLSNVEQNLSNGKHLTVSSDINITLTATDIDEIIQAVIIMYGDVSYATISEIATVTAIPKTINSTLGDINATYVEAIHAQIANHIPANYGLQFSSTGIDAIYTMEHTCPHLR